MHSQLAFLAAVLLAVQGCVISIRPEPAEGAPEPTAADWASIPGHAVLPAPLYFLGEDEQIWRVEADATTLTPITSEPDSVAAFDVSLLDGSLVYITANSLVRTDSTGGGRTVLAAGPPMPVGPGDHLYGAAFSDPIWSPSGQQFAYGSNGVNLYSLDSNASAVLLPSDPFAADTSEFPEPDHFFSPAEWSPDGSRLLVNVSYSPALRALRVVNLGDGSHVNVNRAGGSAPHQTAWSRDGLSVYIAYDTADISQLGLWRVDAISGMSVALIAGEENGVYARVAYPFEAGDGQLYTFMAIVTDFSVGYVPLSMTRSAPDGVTGRTTLRSDGYILADVLWDPAGRGAVVGDMSAQIMGMGYPAQASSPLLWLPADNSPAVALPAIGSTPRWGK